MEKKELAQLKEQQEYNTLNFTLDDLLIIEDKKEIDTFTKPKTSLFDLEKIGNTNKRRKTKVNCKVY